MTTTQQPTSPSTMDALTEAVRGTRAARGAPVPDDPWATEPTIPDDPEADGPPPPDDGDGPRRGAQRAANARPPYKLRVRKAIVGMDWPYGLLAGGEFSGKSMELAKLAASGRFSRCWRLAIGENPDEYHEIADWDIVEHDGTAYEITCAVEQIDAAVRAQPLIDGKPQLVAVDSGSQLWTLLAEIAERRACKSDEARDALLRNPNADVQIGALQWNAVTKMWRHIENLLRKMPAVVVMTARAKDNVAIINGKPDSRAPRVFKPAIQNEAPYATTLYVRLDRELAPQVLGARMANGGVRPGIDEPIIFDGRQHGKRPAQPEFSLEHLIFNVMKFDPAKARTSGLVLPNAADPADQQVAAPRPTPADASEVAGRRQVRAEVAPGPRRGGR